jgi:adenylate cyclase
MGPFHPQDKEVKKTTEAMRLNPFYPDWYLWNVGIAHYPARKYDAVIDAVERMREPRSTRCCSWRRVTPSSAA